MDDWDRKPELSDQQSYRERAAGEGHRVRAQGEWGLTLLQT